MATVNSANQTSVLKPPHQNPPAYECCSVIYTICSWCGGYLGAKDGLGASAINGGICADCEPHVSHVIPEPAASKTDTTAQWSYRVPAPGVKYYGFEPPPASKQH